MGSLTSKLRPHQVESFGHLLGLLQQGINCADLSDTGTGKSFVAAAVATALNLPTLIVAPKIGLYAWEQASKHFKESFSWINYEKIRTGRSPFGAWEKASEGVTRRDDYYVCQCCQREVELENLTPCYCHPIGLHCLVTKKRPQVLGDFIFHSNVKFVIFDEVHRCGALDSLDSRILYAARRDRKLVLGLSATAACSPLQMKALGFVLGLHGGEERNIEAANWQDWGVKKTFWSWVRSKGCGKIPPIPGLRWTVGREEQRKIMAGIHDSIIPSRGVRVRVKDIPNFPERQITAELYDVTDAEKIDKLYAEMREPLAALEEKQLQDLASEHPLTLQIRARQKIELFKVPVMCELVSDYLAKGNAVAIFVNFTQTLDELIKRLNITARIDGRQSFKERAESIAAFQTDTARVIVVQIAAGGQAVSLHDVRGEFPRVGLVCPNFSAVDFKQVCGRLHRDGAKSPAFYRVVLAARTLEEKIKRALDAKLFNLDALNDADLMPENLRLPAEEKTYIK